MNEQELKAIETRLVNRNRPLDIGDQVEVWNFLNEVVDEGEITSFEGVYIWLNGLDDEVKPDKYKHHISGVRRVGDNVSSEDDIRALLTELKETHKRLWSRAATAEGNAAWLRGLLQEAKGIILHYVSSDIIKRATISHFLQESEKALNAVPVEEGLTEHNI